MTDNFPVELVATVNRAQRWSLIAGIVGIVVFMGILQLVIAFILKVRRRQ